MKKPTLCLTLVMSLLIMVVVWAVIQPAGTSRAAAGDAALASAAVVADEVYVPAGAFARGCSPDFSAITCDGDARPINQVFLDAFYIDRKEVSNAEYAACVAAGACRTPLDEDSDTRSDYYSDPRYRNYPVIHVDWPRAAAYCAWRGQRLPTEAEWEKAARGTDLRPFPWGNEVPDCEMANIARSATSPCFGDTTPVDAYEDGASPYGAINMIGNVREWVNDIYDSPYYENTPYYNPQGPSYTDKNEHLVRGGSWADHVDNGCNTWVRIDESNIYYTEYIGFRCARSAADTPPPTPTPVPTPTPLPYDTRSVGPEGGLLWMAYPGRLTALHVPSGTFASDQTVSINYTRTLAAGGRLGVDQFFTVAGDPLARPVALFLGRTNPSPVISGTVGLYRLDGSSWVTSNITVTEQSAKHMVAWISDTGMYGLLGETNRIYLPVTLR